MPMLRLFTALELPAPIIEALVDAQTQLSASLPRTRWVHAENLHLTLRFYGEIPAPQARAVQTELSRLASALPSFTLKLDGLGVFPSDRSPRVLWAGLAGEVTALRALYQRVEQAAVAAGCPSEKRAFRPHLTLARWSEEAPRAQAFSRALTYPLPRLAFKPTALTLFQSQLAPAGPTYTPLWSAPLT